MVQTATDPWSSELRSEGFDNDILSFMTLDTLARTVGHLADDAVAKGAVHIVGGNTRLPGLLKGARADLPDCLCLLGNELREHRDTT